MKTWILALMLVVSVLGGNMAMAQSKKFDVTAEFPGTYLKWIHIAEQEFKRKNLNLDDYIVHVADEGESVAVWITPSDVQEYCARHYGTHTGYQAEVRKKDSKVILSNYIRPFDICRNVTIENGHMPTKK